MPVPFLHHNSYVQFRCVVSAGDATRKFTVADYGAMDIAKSAARFFDEKAKKLEIQLDIHKMEDTPKYNHVFHKKQRFCNRMMTFVYVFGGILCGLHKVHKTPRIPSSLKIWASHV
jgi:hypothetical protein